MGVLIDDLLQFSRTGRAELRIEPVGHGRSRAEALDAAADARPTAATSSWSIGRCRRVDGDQALLRQVWANLLGNAVKYTRAARLAGAASRSARRRRDGEVVFSVRDNGVGFDMQYAHKLFGVFQRLHDATPSSRAPASAWPTCSASSRGARRRVWAEGELGNGATFYFSLPIAKGDAS